MGGGCDLLMDGLLLLSRGAQKYDRNDRLGSDKLLQV